MSLLWPSLVNQLLNRHAPQPGIRRAGRKRKRRTNEQIKADCLALLAAEPRGLTTADIVQLDGQDRALATKRLLSWQGEGLVRSETYGRITRWFVVETQA